MRGLFLVYCGIAGDFEQSIEMHEVKRTNTAAGYKREEKRRMKGI